MLDDVANRIAARADVARLLSACYYQPGSEFAEERVFDSLVEATSRIDPDLASGARRLGEAFAAESVEGLLVDYTRLFLGPVQALARPYGSIWLEADEGLMQASTSSVLAFYSEGGFDIAEDFRDLPDHVAAELEFLYVLLFREAVAEVNGDPQARSTADDLRRRFLKAHLGAWASPFTAAAAASAQCAFYRELAQLTDRFVRMETDEPAA